MESDESIAKNLGRVRVTSKDTRRIRPTEDLDGARTDIVTIEFDQDAAKSRDVDNDRVAVRTHACEVESDIDRIARPEPERQFDLDDNTRISFCCFEPKFQLSAGIGRSDTPSVEVHMAICERASCQQITKLKTEHGCDRLLHSNFHAR